MDEETWNFSGSSSVSASSRHDDMMTWNDTPVKLEPVHSTFKTASVQISDPRENE